MSDFAVEQSFMLQAVLTDAIERFGPASQYGDDLQWYAFPEVWGSSALCFGGVGGQMMTSAQTIVVLGPGDAAIYVGGQFWRRVPSRRAQEIVAARRSNV
jgi:hypothetical protein